MQSTIESVTVIAGHGKCSSMSVGSGNIAEIQGQSFVLYGSTQKVNYRYLGYDKDGNLLRKIENCPVDVHYKAMRREDKTINKGDVDVIICSIIFAQQALEADGKMKEVQDELHQARKYAEKIKQCIK